MAKKVQLSKKINGVVHQIYPKTVYDVVVDKNGKTLLLDIETINSDLEIIEDSIPTKLSDLQGGAEIVTESEINAKLDNYYTKDTVDSKLENIGSGTVDLKNYYTKNEVYNKSQVDGLLDDVQIQDLSGYAKKSDLFSKDYNDLDNRPTIISKEEVIELIDQAQFPEGGDIELLNYYTKGEVYNKEEVDALIASINAELESINDLLDEIGNNPGGGGSSIEIITFNDTTTPPSDEKVYSALKVNNEFTRNNEEETINKQWLFEDKTIFNGNVEFNKAIQKPAIFEEHIQSPYYEGNVLGSGWYLGFNNGTNSHLEVDTLKVRKKAIFDTLEIKHVAHVGGEIMLTPAGATIELTRKLTSNDFDGAFKDHFICYIKTTDSEGNTIENQFAENDLVMCKTFNVVDPNDNATVNNTYYWRKCIEVGIEEETKKSYIILSNKTDEKDAQSDEPKEGDVIVTVGNTDDSSRQNAIVLSSYASTAPSIVLYKGINTFELTEEKAPVIISPEKNKFTGDVFISNPGDFTETFVEILENLISLQVLGVTYEEILGSNAVKGSGVISEDGKSITFDLDPIIYKIWSKEDTIANILRFKLEVVDKKEEITTPIIIKLIDPSSDTYFNEISIDPKEIDLKLSKAAILLKNPSSDTFRIEVSNEDKCLPWALEVRSSFIKELKSRTGIDIKEGQIILQADNTRIDTSDGKTLAKFTEDSIKLNTYLGVSSPVNGREAAKTISEDGRTIYLNSEVVGSWEANDTILVELKLAEMPKDNTNTDTDTIELQWVGVGGVFDEDKATITLKSTFTGTLEYSCNQLVRDLDNPRLIITNGKVESATIRRTMKYDLKRTGIDIEGGTITLSADTTLIKDGDDELSLAEFTRDQINLNVYEPYGEIFGEDAVVNYTKPEGTRVGVALNSDITKNWKANDIISIKLKYNKFTAEKRKDVSISGPAGTFTQFDIPQKEIYSETIRTFTITSIPNIITINSENLPDEVLVRRVFPDGLKRTGIDIENGRITLDAEETIIKDSGKDLTLAKFTLKQIELNTYNDENYYTYGKNAVLEIDNTGKYSTITLDSLIIVGEGWTKDDVIDIVIETNLELSYDVNVSFNGPVPSSGTTIVDIPRDSKTANTQVIISDYVGNFTGGKKSTISFSFAELNDIVNAKVRRATIESKLNKTGINIADGVIVLDANGTYINDGNTTLAGFTKELIDLAVLGDVTDLYYEDDAVYSFLIFDGRVCKVNFKTEVANLWKYGDVIYFTIEFEEKITDTLLLTPTGPFGVQNLNIVLPSENVSINNNHKIGTYLTFTENPDFSDVSEEYFNGLIISFGKEDTVFKTIEARREILTSEFKKTSIDILNGLITLNADKTVIKDGENSPSIAEFTKDKVSLSVYDSIKETLGENVVSNTVGKNSNKIVYSLNSELTYKWDYAQDLKLIIKFAKTAKDFINSLTITSLFNTILLNNEDINTFIYKDVAWTGRLGQQHLLTLEAKFKSGDILPELDTLIEAIELRQTIKSGLKRTGIDIESGLITLDADKTLIKGSNLTLAEFTDDKISFKIGDYDVNAVRSITFDQSKLTSTIYLLSNYIKNWTSGDDIIVKLTFAKIPNSQITLTWSNIGGAIPSKAVTITNLNSTIEFTCTGNISTSSTASLIVPGGLVTEAVIYRKLTDAIKYTGIDLESGQITLDSERTLIKSGGKDIALFSTDEYGRAFIRTELIDAANISANYLETKGTTNNDNEKINYISIANNSMKVYDDSGSIKTLIHSGTLASTLEDVVAFPCIGQNLTLTPDYRKITTELVEAIATTSELNCGYLDPLTIKITATNKTLEMSSISDIILRPYLCTTDDTIVLLFTPYTISSGAFINNSYTGTIKFHGSVSLLKDVNYKIVLMVERHTKSAYDYAITISQGSHFGVVPILPTTEIASNGYNFNFSGLGYLNANQSGFVTEYGLYGLKIDGSGIYVKGSNISGWKKLDLSKLQFAN